MSNRRDSIYEIEQKIFLGGQVSNKHKEYQTINLMSPDFAEVYIILNSLKEFEKTTDPIELAKSIIMKLGQVDLMRSWTELTKLSAVLGDTRKHYSFKDVMK